MICLCYVPHPEYLEHPLVNFIIDSGLLNILCALICDGYGLGFGESSSSCQPTVVILWPWLQFSCL